MTSLENFRLTVFRKVAEQLSFRKAAEELYLSQPAVSLQIKALEEELGVVLFDRSGSQVKLTLAGATLLKYAEQSRRLLREARHATTAFSGTHSGTLTLGASTTIAQYVLPRLLSEFCSAHPRVHVTLMSNNTEQIVTAVAEEKVALGFIEGPPRSRDLTLAPFLEDELVLLAPAAHEWAEQAEIAPAALATAHLLMRERGSGTRHIVERALELAQRGHGTRFNRSYQIGRGGRFWRGLCFPLGHRQGRPPGTCVQNRRDQRDSLSPPLPDDFTQGPQIIGTGRRVSQFCAGKHRTKTQKQARAYRPRQTQISRTYVASEFLLGPESRLRHTLDVCLKCFLSLV
jgi:DNA-binding transcriptional LysR family regulator